MKRTQKQDEVPEHVSEAAQMAHQLEKKARSRSRQRAEMAAETETDAKGMVIQLPIWPEPARAIPNDLARSALFSVQNRNKTRQYLKNVQIAAFGSTEISYTGEQLRQDDNDVFLQIQHLARGQQPDHPILFRPGEMVRELRWPKKGQSYERLMQCILRLSSNTIQISCKAGVFGGSLIRKFVYKPDQVRGEAVDDTMRPLIDKGYWAIWLEPEITQLFRPSTYTLLDWQQRLSLSPLAKWLHSYYKGHAIPFPIKVATIREKCGSDTQRLYHFRGQIKTALDQLVKLGFLVKWHIDDNDLVHVSRVDQQCSELPTP